MKAITKVKTNISGNQITITGELMDFTPHPIQSQRVTQLHFVSTNPQKPRHIVAGSEGLFIKRHGSDGVCFPRDEMIALALEIDQTLTDAPRATIPLTADLKPGFKTEIPATIEWFESADEGKTWSAIPTPSKQPGAWIKCVATNKQGSTESNIHKFPKAT
jgi:hypothetical protein